VQRGRLQCSLHVRFKDKYPSVELRESQLIEFRGKQAYIGGYDVKKITHRQSIALLFPHRETEQEL